MRLGSTEPAVLAEAATDYGNIVHRRPRAVVCPETIDEVVDVVRHCRRTGLHLAARGQGHSTDGQAQVEDGIVVDMRGLRRVEQVGDGFATVQAGLTWRDLIGTSIPRGWVPPVLTGYTGLSIGGTLSMGGIGGSSFREGAQVDHAIELDVVTGDGELVSCSAETQPLLFDAVRGGVGQYGIIVRARLRMVRTLPRARMMVLTYSSASRFFADLDALALRDREIEGVYGQIIPAGDRWTFVIHAVRFVAGDANETREAALERLLFADFQCDERRVTTLDRLAFDTVVDRGNAERVKVGLGDLPRIWLDAFLPASSTEGYVDETLRTLAPSMLGPAGFVLLFPIRNRQGSSGLRLPASERVYLFDVLMSGAPGDNEFVTRGRDMARSSFERARALGGTLYPIGSTPMSPEDWLQQLGPHQARFRDAKRRFDPAGLLAPGAGIYRPRPET